MLAYVFLLKLLSNPTLAPKSSSDMKVIESTEVIIKHKNYRHKRFIQG